METGAEVQCLKGHTRAIRALQFDAAKLITASMDHTLKVWNWRNGTCVRTLEGHTEGVVCLNYDSNVLASGSVDTTVKVWNFRTGECFTLRGHRDWVNAVHLWDGPGSVAKVPGQQELDLDPGKMLFSASDDGSIRLWDLNLRTCVRQFAGHVGQVQSIRLVMLDGGCGGDDKAKDDEKGKARESEKSGPVPVLISGSLDNTIRIWDVESGKARKTLFGHIEGVWSVQSDKLRVVSASHDRTIKVSRTGLLTSREADFYNRSGIMVMVTVLLPSSATGVQLRALLLVMTRLCLGATMGTSKSGALRLRRGPDAE